MKWKLTLAAAMLAATQGCAIGAPKEKLPPDAVLLENGPAKVTARDFDAAMTRFPENIRDEARAYPAIIMRNLDALFVNRIAAERAKAAGLDKDPLVAQRRVQLEEAYLAQKYIDHLYDSVKVPDLSLRAEEIYKADTKRFLLPASAELDDIIVSFVARTPEQARDRAREAEQHLRAGEDLFAVGSTYSDDKNVPKSRGDLGVVRVQDLEEPLRNALETLKPGDISAPIRATGAYHVLRVRSKVAARQRTFAEVKQAIMDEEEKRLRTKATEDFLNEVRTSPANTLHKDRVESLRSDFDPAKIGAAKQQAIEQVLGQGQSR
jgi:parvulin-like peptidyl-prolyl isomerase